MTKFKIFDGYFDSNTGPGDYADVKANKWLEAHPEVTVISYEYRQARYGMHSLCIEYVGD